MCCCHSQIKAKFVFFNFLIVKKTLEFNNFYTKGLNATKLAQMVSSMHKGVQGLCFMAFGHVMQEL